MKQKGFTKVAAIVVASFWLGSCTKENHGAVIEDRCHNYSETDEYATGSYYLTVYEDGYSVVSNRRDWNCGDLDDGSIGG